MITKKNNKTNQSPILISSKKANKNNLSLFLT
jgi:hypothetical protein